MALQAEPVVDALLAMRPALRSAMAAKSRALFPVKTLLAATQLREQLGEMLSGLRACFPGVPLALVVPSPRRWIALSYCQVFGADADAAAGPDGFDSASMYVADFLRCFSEAIRRLLARPASSELPSFRRRRTPNSFSTGLPCCATLACRRAFAICRKQMNQD
jgi:hypothetical protein